MDLTKIVVDVAPFSVGDEYNWLAQSDADGAVVTFTGKVRNHNLGNHVSALTLEHYPGMTEKALAEIVAEARTRWPLQRVSVYHRVGPMYPGDEIVFVGVTSAPRPVYRCHGHQPSGRPLPSPRASRTVRAFSADP